MVMTYNSLVLEIMDYLDRTDPDTLARVPDFIYQAHQRICREAAGILEEEAYITGMFTVGLPNIQKPANWRRTLTFNYGTGNPMVVNNQIQLRTYEFIRNYWPNPTLTGLPLFYADYGLNNWLVGPTPNATYPYEIAYIQLPTPITVNNQTNSLTDYCPDLLLYACLLEAIPFEKNDERIPVWQSYYDRGLASLTMQDKKRYVDRDSDRSSD